jgi:hypothetical protein
VEDDVLVLRQLAPRFAGEDPALRDEDGAVDPDDVVLARFPDINEFEILQSGFARGQAVTVCSVSVASGGVIPQNAS